MSFHETHVDSFLQDGISYLKLEPVSLSAVILQLGIDFLHQVVSLQGRVCGMITYFNTPRQIFIPNMYLNICFSVLV